jgi:DNA-binding transcriptional MocR family regulator
MFLPKSASKKAGMHLIGWLQPGTDDRAASLRALANGVEAPQLSAYAQGILALPGLVLGYTAVLCEELTECVRRLAVWL